MAWRRRHDIGVAFRNDHQLQQFVLTNVTPTGKILGTGSYGSVEEVSYKHLVCAGKKLHETLIDMENEGVAEVVHKYQQECQLMSSLRHPNITQFLGLCFLPDTQLPLLVMERLETSLDDLLEHMPSLPLSLKRSVLEDVARGLLYLHDRPTPIIHRDLTSKNVLLTSSLVAKITDMGNSRIVNMRPGQMARTLSKLPGTAVYMPPEAQDDAGRYGPSLDIFSFGHLALYTVTQKFPGNLLPSTYFNPDNDQEVRGRSEVERREVYIELLESTYNTFHPTLVELVKQCLHNNPRGRPSTEELLTRLQEMRGAMEVGYGGPFKLDMVRVKLAKELKDKEEELTQQQARHNVELAEITRQLEERERQVTELQAENNQLQNEIVAKDGRLQERGRRVEELLAEVQVRDDRNQQLQNNLEAFGIREAELIRELETKASELARLRIELGNCQEQRDRKKLLLEFTWRRHLDMPFEMCDHIQSVVIQGMLYIGGGIAINDNEVMKYDIAAEKWGTLPPYRAFFFAMSAINTQLALVGGFESNCSKLIGIWMADRKEWTYPYPEMPTARCHSSVIVHKEWLVVAGGQSEVDSLPCVEVLNTDSKVWYTGPSTPAPWDRMKTAVVGNMAYFMGGRQGVRDSEKIYCICVQHLISHITSTHFSEASGKLWTEIPELKLTGSSPLSIGGSLLAFGGRSRDRKTVTDIHLYQPENGLWVKIGDLPSPRCDCTCIMTADWKLLVAGGWNAKFLKTVDIAQLKQC